MDKYLFKLKNEDNRATSSDVFILSLILDFSQNKLHKRKKDAKGGGRSVLYSLFISSGSKPRVLLTVLVRFCH